MEPPAQILECILALRAIVGEELQPFGGWQLMAKALKEGFAEEFADVQGGEARL